MTIKFVPPGPRAVVQDPHVVDLEVTDSSSDTAHVRIYKDQTFLVFTDGGKMVIFDEDDLAVMLAEIKKQWYPDE